MILYRSLPAFLLLSAAVTAQTQNTLLFSGRFPFVSLDAVNERPGGSITKLEEFDFSRVTPGNGAVARSVLPATAMQCYLGDANNDNNYLKFAAFKTYFENLQIGGLFVRNADRANVTWDRIYFTVRDNVTVAGRDFEVFTNNGTAVHTLVPGDWVRLLPNGNVEFFMTAAQLAIAAGPPSPSGLSIHGAHALAQAANGDLFYAPVQGGHWVNGNQVPPVFCNDGALVKIDNANITYDANGNIQSFTPNSARLLTEEVGTGSGSNPVSIRLMVTNAAAMDFSGTQIIGSSGSPTVYAKTSGLGIDPNGGTFSTSYPDAGGLYTNEPNLLFCSDAGRYGGTIFSTANNGSVATINGVLCGSQTPTVPATGAWLGVQLDVGNFQPTLMGLTVVDSLAYDPLLIDQANFGVLPVASTQATWDIDCHSMAPFTVVFLFASFGPGVAGLPVFSLPLSAFPPLLTASSHEQIFVANSPVALGLLVTDGAGFGTWSFNNPNAGGYTNVRFLLQAAAPVGNLIQVSTPVMTQLQ